MEISIHAYNCSCVNGCEYVNVSRPSCDVRCRSAGRHYYYYCVWSSTGGVRGLFSARLWPITAAPNGLHRGPSVAWRTLGAPGARGVNKYSVKRMLREVWKKSKGETLRFFVKRAPSSLPLLCTCTASHCAHLLTHLHFSFHPHLTWKFTVQINSGSNSGPSLV